MSQKHQDKFRLNAGIILLNKEGKVWLGKNTNTNHWQFPQGGIDNNETAEQAMLRELYEETGIKAEQVKIIAESKKWYTYKFPKSFTNNKSHPYANFEGQKQKWFLLLLKDQYAEFNLSIHNEFESYRWVTYWYPIRNIVYFKEEVYRKVLKEFAKFVFSKKPNY